MSGARERLQAALAQTQIMAPDAIFIPNAEAKPVSDPERIRQLLALQLTSPVRWVETIREATALGVKCFIEIGPGKVLKGLVRRIDPEAEVLPFGEPADLEKILAFFQNAGCCNAGGGACCNNS
jgi:[acyl-carrier-protein] S-malonyltransferase